MRLAERRVASGRFQEEEEDGDDEAIQIENTFYEADDNKVFASCSQKKSGRNTLFSAAMF